MERTLFDRITGKGTHLVRFQAALLREQAPADLAGIRPLAAVRLQVDLQVAGRLEALPADAAAVRPLHRVLLLVLAQLCDGAEALFAVHAHARDGRRVRLGVLAQRHDAGHLGAARDAGEFPLVLVSGPLVRLQGVLLDKRLAAGFAAEGTLPGVQPLVCFQRVGLVEAFAARFAFVRLLAGVYAQVALQVPRYGEALFAVVAVVQPLPGVDPPVQLQAVSSVETLPALVAAERPHVGVETLVVPQQLPQGETLPTNITGVGPLTYRQEDKGCKWQQNVGNPPKHRVRLAHYSSFDSNMLIFAVRGKKVFGSHRLYKLSNFKDERSTIFIKRSGQSII